MNWHLPSRSGRLSAQWLVIDRSNGQFIYDFVLAAVSYNDSEASPLPGGPADLDLQLRGLRVSERVIDSFSTSLDAWLRLPLKEQWETELDVEALIGGRFDESLVLQLGPDANIISERQPVARFTFNVAGVSGMAAFQCDQSCIRGFTDDLQSSLDAGAA